MNKTATPIVQNITAFHPAIWFKDIFETLDILEKQAWLVLFTLAYISKGTSPIHFISDQQISDLFGIDEAAFKSAVDKAVELGRIRIIKTAVVPSSVIEQDLGLDDYEESRKLGLRVLPAKTKHWARYKTMIFLSYFEEWNTHWAREHEPFIPFKHPLDGDIIGPFLLLAKLLRIAEIRGRNRMMPSPYKKQTLFSTRVPEPSDIPDVYIFHDEASGELNLERLWALTPGFHLWSENHNVLGGTIYECWEEIESWLVDFAARESKDSSPTAEDSLMTERLFSIANKGEAN